MNIRKTITFALMLFLLPAAASAAQDPDKEEIKVSGQKELYPSVHRCPPLHTLTLTPPITGATVHSQRNLVAPNIEVVFPNPCATLPLDRNGWTSLGPVDVGTTADLPILFPFSLFGFTYTSLQVNNDGYMQFFDGTTTADVNGWRTDIDTSGTASGLVWYKTIGTNTFAAAWDRVGVYDKNDFGPNTFQIMISDGTNQNMGMGNNVCLCYLEMGSVDFLEANVGISNSASASIPLGVFDQPGMDYDGPNGMKDGWDYLENKSFCYQE